MKQRTHQITHPAFAKAAVYAALNGYIEVHSPTRVDMIGNSYTGRSADSWLEIATDNAKQMGDEADQASSDIESVEALVKRSEYTEARRTVLAKMQAADAEIQHIGLHETQSSDVQAGMQRATPSRVQAKKRRS